MRALLTGRIKQAGMICLLLLAAFFAGQASQQLVYAGPSPSSPYKKLNIFGRVLAYIENNYVEEVTEEQLIYGAIQGMVDTLDPHTSFMPPAIYQEIKQTASGEFGGIGLDITRDENTALVVVAAIEGTPAARAGLKRGDILLSIDETPTKNLEIHEAISALRGSKGTQVLLTVERDKKPLSFRLTRENIKLVAVTHKFLGDGIGYIRIKQFQEKTAKQVEMALQEFSTSPNGFKGLILDLRDNPGGLLAQAVQVADSFLASGLIVSTEGKGKRSGEKFYAHPKGTHLGFPLVLLVNGGSASASEVVAGALQDHRRAIIFGETTFGKGSVQTLIELEDGSGLKLTIARYYTPKHLSIQEVGIKPDIFVSEHPPSHPDTQRKKIQREVDLERHLKNKTPKGKAQKKQVSQDYVLSRAVEYLSGWQLLSSQGAFSNDLATLEAK